jgi:hypothetical protein
VVVSKLLTHSVWPPVPALDDDTPHDRIPETPRKKGSFMLTLLMPTALSSRSMSMMD